ncbi:glycosyltransferase family 2 protein [Psychrobacter sanguinis]|uniref:Glycosyltransferase n=1 Tax=Psychrobacter sanguinis TaxID=861445 RepID=A0A844LYE7_9GAMM|nr:glycosyltransferase [Psychrobacter sanguinis]MUG31583.1 glycosyltransferase [Psychrobacter sanguinis]
MTYKPLLSIVIPTKNRQKYCLSAVNSILAIQSDKVQIVIQDNSDNSTLEEMLPDLNNSNKLKYNYSQDPVSFVENFNNAIASSDGEYICMIGDDDGINPEIIIATEWAKNYNIDCLVGNIKAYYRWGGVGTQRGLITTIPDNSLTITQFNGIAKEVDVEKSLMKLMKNGCTNYTQFKLPKLYHGIVKKEALSNLKKQTGSYLKGLSPDIYASIALACTINKLIEIDYPLTIPGICAESGSVKEGIKKENPKELDKAPHFKGRTEPYQWEKNVPKVYCVETIWADSGFAALREFNRIDLIAIFDEYMLYTNILLSNPDLKDKVSEHLLNKYPDKHSHLFKMSKSRGKGLAKNIIHLRGARLIKRVLKLESFNIIKDVEDIESATNVLTEYLENSKLSLLDCLNKSL